MDREAWWPTIYRVAKRWTWLSDWAQTHARESILNPCEINWNVFRTILSVIYKSKTTNLQVFWNYSCLLLLYFPAHRCSQMGSRHNILNCIFQKTLSNVNSATRLLYLMVTCNFCWNTVRHCFKAKPPSRHWYFESSLICESRVNGYIRPDVSNTIIPCWSWIRLIIKECHLKTKCFQTSFPARLFPLYFPGWF